MRNRAFGALLATTLLSAAPSLAQPIAPPPTTVVPTGAPAPADPTVKARERFVEGVRLVKKKEWSQAYDAFLDAWKLKQHPQIALNLGHVEMEIGKYRDAIGHLQHWLDNSPAGDPDSVLVRERLTQAKKKVVTLKIKVNGAGAEVQIDGQPVGISPLPQEVYVEPGKHTIAARRGPARDEVTGTYEAGLTQVIPLVPMAPEAPRVGSTPNLGGTTERPFPVRTVVLAGGGAVTLTGFAIGIAGIVLSAGKAGERDAYCAGVPDKCLAPRTPENSAVYDAQKAEWTRLDDERISNSKMAIAGFVVSGLAAIGTGAALFIWKPSPSKTDAKQAIRILPAGAGAVLETTW